MMLLLLDLVPSNDVDISYIIKGFKYGTKLPRVRLQIPPRKVAPGSMYTLLCLQHIRG